jgi:hypothetical protein
MVSIHDKPINFDVSECIVHMDNIADDIDTKIGTNDLPDLSALTNQPSADFSRGPSQPSADPEFDDIGDELLSDIPNEPRPQELQPATPEDSKKAFEERLILQLYQSKFPADLQMLGAELMMVSALPLAKLVELRRKCDIVLGASSSTENKRKLFNSCIYGLEKVTTQCGYSTEGMTALLLSDSDFQRDLMRLSLKYLNADETSAELTVGMKLVSTMVQCNANNEIKEKVNKSARGAESEQNAIGGIDNVPMISMSTPAKVSAAEAEKLPNLTELNEKYADL